MTTARIITVTLTTIEHDLVALRHRLALALPTIGSRLQGLDGFPSVASGADAGPGGGQRTMRIEGDDVPVTSVEDAALRRVADGGPTARLDDLADLVRTSAHALRLAHRELDKLAGAVTEADKRAMTCTLCTNIAVAPPGRNDGLCVRCGREKDAERRKEEQRRADKARSGRVRYHAAS